MHKVKNLIQLSIYRWIYLIIKKINNHKMMINNKINNKDKITHRTAYPNKNYQNNH
jgi:hypothetical protein